jgi:hypothetical protein
MPPTAILRALNTRLLRFVLRFAVAALVLIVVLFCGFRAYTVYLTHRAVLLLDEATRIQIGANEDSILPLVARFDVFKQAPPPPEPTEDCPVTVDSICMQNPPQSREDLGYWNAHHPDYTYEVTISPFDLFGTHLIRHQQPRGIDLALAYLMFRTPIFLRNLVSLRDWDAFAAISIRGGRVEAVAVSTWRAAPAGSVICGDFRQKCLLQKNRRKPIAPVGLSWS